MRRVVLVAAGVLVAMSGAVPVAYAAAPGPLYHLVDTATQRLQTADPVAAYKWVNGGSIEDRARVGQVLDTVGADARDHGIDEAFVRQIFTDQVHATEGVEYIRFGQWKFDPAHAPTAAPGLSETRTAIDGFNGAMVAEMAAQRDVLFGPGCAAALDEARAAVATARALDPLYRQALDVATSSYCR
jgi:chorismate mutase